MQDKYTPVLKQAYNEASKTELDNLNGLSPAEKADIEIIVRESDTCKGVYSVLTTSLVEKIVNPRQDIRKHQANMNGGYSGRSIDTAFVTPFLKSLQFPAMKESGWLTRSLEQNYLYDLRYRGKIRNKEVKQSFLRLIDNIENKGKSAKLYLIYLFKSSIANRDSQQIILVNPIDKDSELTIEDTIYLLWEHFNSHYSGRGASRLPALAIYSIYQCIIKELKRFEGKKLIALEEHTSADCRSGYIGDISVVNQDGSFAEGVEVKHKILITSGMVKDVFEKIRKTTVSRFYILSTAEPSTKEAEEIKELIKAIREKHGCQIIVNGVMPTLKYYLRLVSNTDDFLVYYLDNIKKDSCIRKEHKERWNKLLQDLLSLKDE